jgi:hypothetical protein
VEKPDSRNVCRFMKKKTHQVGVIRESDLRKRVRKETQ